MSTRYDIYADIHKMSDAQLEREVTDLRNAERALRHWNRYSSSKGASRYAKICAICARITALALEQGRRESETN